MRKSQPMPSWVAKELRANFARASRVEYRAREHALRIALTNGAAVTLPVKLVPSLRGAAARDVRAVEVLGRGGGLHWGSLDLDLSVSGLISSVFAGPEWLAELGRVGGRKSSAVEAAAARRDDRKGGRPRIRSRADSGES